MTDFFKISPPKAVIIFLISLFVPLVRWVFVWFGFLGFFKIVPPPPNKGFCQCCEAVGGTTFKKPLIIFKKVTTP